MKELKGSIRLGFENAKKGGKKGIKKRSWVRIETNWKLCDFCCKRISRILKEMSYNSKRIWIWKG